MLLSGVICGVTSRLSTAFLNCTVVAPEEASQRERFEAVARSLRDLLTQRWLLTQETHDRENPK